MFDLTVAREAMGRQAVLLPDPVPSHPLLDGRPEIGRGNSTKDAVMISPQIARMPKEIRYPWRIRSYFFAPKFCAVKAFKAEAKPSAVFQETDSICRRTRSTAMAAAPKAETILVSTMEIMH